MTNDLKYLYMHLLTICISSTKKKSSNTLTIVIGLTIFSLLRFKSSFYIVDTSPLFLYDSKIFSSISWLDFSLYWWFLLKHIFFLIFTKVKLSIF